MSLSKILNFGNLKIDGSKFFQTQLKRPHRSISNSIVFNGNNYQKENNNNKQEENDFKNVKRWTLVTLAVGIGTSTIYFLKKYYDQNDQKNLFSKYSKEMAVILKENLNELFRFKVLHAKDNNEQKAGVRVLKELDF